MLIVLSLIVTGMAIGLATSTQAHHAEQNPQGWHDLYPGRSGHVSYKAWTVNAGPVPTQDALLILNDVENVWEPMFDYALAAGGEPQFHFQPLAYNQSAEAQYARMDTVLQVQWFCAGATVACFAAQVDGDNEIISADIIYGPNVWQDPNDAFQQSLAHEFGHGVALAHHGSCGFVMGPDGCTDLATAADIATALDVVFGY